MTPEQLKALFPNASPDFIAQNCGQAPHPVAEPALRHEPLAAPAGKKGHPTRIRVSITSFRRTLLDPDNLCPKYFIDSLRYAGLIPNDTAKDIELQIRQEKVAKAEERTEITIEPANHD